MYILTNSNHVLQLYLSERSLTQYNLRQRTHSKELLQKTTELNHRNFLIVLVLELFLTGTRLLSILSFVMSCV